MSETLATWAEVNYHPYDVIQSINETNSTSDKENKLKKFKKNDTWLKVVTYSYDPKFTFNIKKLPMELDTIRDLKSMGKSEDKIQLTKMFRLLDDLMLRVVTGNKAKLACNEFLKQTSRRTGELFYLIIKGDLKVGCNKRTFREAYGDGIVHLPAYMGAVSFKPHLVKALFNSCYNRPFIENKADGMYGAVVINKTKGLCYIESRQGEIILGMNKILKSLYKSNLFQGIDYVLNGEIMIKGVDRAKANGIVRAIKSLEEKVANGEHSDKKLEKFRSSYGMSLEEAKDKIYMQIWDWLPYENYRQGVFIMPRYKRLQKLEEELKGVESMEVINYIQAQTYDEAIAFFAQQLKDGLEGVICKSYNGEWKDSRPSYQIKMKIVFTSDLVIKGFVEGQENTRLEGTLGSLICETSDGKLRTGVGGFNDHERFEIWSKRDFYLNKIIEVVSNGITKAQNADTHALNYAQAYKIKKKMVIRHDKDEANSLKEVIAIEEAAMYGKCGKF